MTARTVRTKRGAFVEFFSDKEFYRRLYMLALPLAIQQFIMSSLNMVGVVMIGQLGEVPVAAVGLANQIFFLLTLVLFGVYTGCAIFTAQLWGRGDVSSIRRVMGLALTLGIVIGSGFMLIAELFPDWAIGVYSQDAAVVAAGSKYLRIIGIIFILYSISFCFSALIRSTGDVQTPLVVTMTILSLNTLLSYLLIFGKLGLPALGVRGAAIAVLVSRSIECVMIIILVYRKHSPIAGTMRELFSFDLQFARSVLKPVLPVVINEALWSMGTTAYSVVYARISTESIAAMNIISSIDQMALVLFSAIGNACAIMVGNSIGAGDEDQAFRIAARAGAISMAGGIVIGSIVLASSNSILSLYNVPPIVIDYAHRVLTILGLLLWLRACNVILFIGIFRSGGDTRFALVLDGLIIWAVGVPLAYIGAFIFHLPVYWVYLLVMSEEISKWSLGVYRFFSRKWIHNVATTVSN